MSTSGTVATTVIDTSALLEHAFRRVRVLPAAQTPETVLVAKECLYMLLLNLGNRGLNLWCVEKVLLGLQAGRATYTTPAGTLDVLNVLHTQPTLADGAFAATSTGGIFTATTSVKGLRLGVKFSTAYTGVLTLSSSEDGISYAAAVTVPSATYAADQFYWFELPVAELRGYYSVDGPSATYPALADVIVAFALYDLPTTQWSRDTYAAINAKAQMSHPVTNYFFEKKLTPTLTLWPVPDIETNHITMFTHRQPQDVGTLVQQLDIPQRWLDGIIWLLAARLCFELPSVDVNLAQLVVQMADKQEFEAEQSESDGAPIYLTPGVGVYTR